MRAKLISLSTLALTLLASITAQATNAGSAQSEMYLKVVGGVSGSHKTEYGKNDAKKSDSLMESLSFAGGAYLGYHIAPNIRAEAGVDYNHSLQYQYALPIQKTDFTDTGIQIRNYEMKIFTPMVKGYYDIPINADSTNLYIGIGAGYSFISGSSELDKQDQEKAHERQIEGRNVAFAGMAGISHKMSDSITAELGYQFGYHGKPQINTSTDKSEDLFNVLTHSVNVGVRFAL